MLNVERSLEQVDVVLSGLEVLAIDLKRFIVTKDLVLEQKTVG